MSCCVATAQTTEAFKALYTIHERDVALRAAAKEELVAAFPSLSFGTMIVKASELGVSRQRQQRKWTSKVGL